MGKLSKLFMSTEVCMRHQKVAFDVINDRKQQLPNVGGWYYVDRDENEDGCTNWLLHTDGVEVPTGLLVCATHVAYVGELYHAQSATGAGVGGEGGHEVMHQLGVLRDPPLHLPIEKGLEVLHVTPAHTKTENY